MTDEQGCLLWFAGCFLIIAGVWLGSLPLGFAGFLIMIAGWVE